MICSKFIGTAARPLVANFEPFHFTPGGPGFYVDLVDMPRHRFGQSLLEVVQFRRLPFDDNAYPAIGQVFHPARDSEPCRYRTGRIAKADALDVTRIVDFPAFPTFLAHGKKYSKRGVVFRRLLNRRAINIS